MPGQPQDRQRSAPFAEFLALAGDPELLVFSLQGGVHQRDIQQFGAGGLVHDVGRGIFDFAEAASALSQLDLLLSIDAPIAHLAAAMGVGPGSCRRRRSTGAGSSAAPGRPGILRRACFASPGRAIGSRCSPGSGPNSPFSSRAPRRTDLPALQILPASSTSSSVSAEPSNPDGSPPACRRAPVPSTIGRPRTRCAAAASGGVRRPARNRRRSPARRRDRAGRAGERHGRCGRRAGPECRCRPAPPDPAAAPGTAASCAARDRPFPEIAVAIAERRRARPDGRGSHRASRTARPSSGGRSPAADLVRQVAR